MNYARDHLIPLVDEGLGNSAYLADLGDGRALAVDASRDLRTLRRTAARLGLTVAFAADTHLHADFLSGAGLAEVNRRGPAPLTSAPGLALLTPAALALSVLAVRDTAAWARAEAPQHPGPPGPHPPFREIALRVSWTNRTLAAVSQAGLVNNLNDGLVWVALPVLLVSHGVSVTGVGYIKALYPFMWAAGMIATGHRPPPSRRPGPWPASDRIGRGRPPGPAR